MIAYIKTPSALIINIDNEQFTVRKNNPKYGHVFETVKQLSNNSTEGDAYQKEVNALKSLLAPINRIKFNKEFGLDIDNNGNLYLEGITQMLPPEMASYIKEAIDNQENVINILNFFRLLVDNPDPAVQKQLFSFLQHNGHPITTNGYFVAYKYVSVKSAYVEEEVEVPREITEEVPDDSPTKKKTTAKKTTDAKSESKFAGYAEIIMTTVEAARKRKQSRKRYFAAIDIEDEQHLIFIFAEAKVGDDVPLKEGYKFLEDKEGKLTLDEMYSDLLNTDVTAEAAAKVVEEEKPKMKTVTRTILETVKKKVKSTVFTDSYTGTMDIILGIPVKQDRKNCDPNPDRTCSNGLHVGSMEYVKGNKMILSCLINPSNVVSIPRDYNNTKMRCCEYFPFAVTHEEHQEKFSDHDYKNYSEEDLGKQPKSVAQATKQSIL